MGEVLGPKVIFLKDEQLHDQKDIIYFFTNSHDQKKMITIEELFLQLGFDHDDRIEIEAERLSSGSGGGGHYDTLRLISQKRGVFNAIFASDYEQHSRKKYITLEQKTADELSRECYFYDIKEQEITLAWYAENKLSVVGEDICTINYEYNQIVISRAIGAKKVEVKVEVPPEFRQSSPKPTHYRLQSDKAIVEYLQTLDFELKIEEIFLNIKAIMGDEINIAEHFSVNIKRHFPPFSGTRELTDEIAFKDDSVVRYSKTTDNEMISVNQYRMNQYSWNYQNRKVDLIIGYDGSYKLGSALPERNTAQDFHYAEKLASEAIATSKTYNREPKLGRMRRK